MTCLLAAALLIATGSLAGGTQPPGGAKDGPKPAPKDPNSATARSVRWVLRFKSSDGPDYVNQLAALGAVVLVPLPPDNKPTWYVQDLKKPTEKRLGTDADLKKLIGLVRFSDDRPESVKAVREVLGVNDEVKAFWAFLPRKLEDDLAAKEKAYRNRRAEDIEQTIFRVTVRDGKPEITVDDQTVKR